ncbi:MAG: hypothetical protein ICV66_05155 [Chitinophagaceae bacterium]|nr:hypothetical protein [Chitinophagaceae bacterium]
MPRSRRRHGHHYQKPSDIPARQRTRGSTVTMILFAVFGLVIALFAAGNDYASLTLGAVIGGIIGYFTGKAMQRGARK